MIMLGLTDRLCSMLDSISKVAEAKKDKQAAGIYALVRYMGAKDQTMSRASCVQARAAIASCFAGATIVRSVLTFCLRR